MGNRSPKYLKVMDTTAPAGTPYDRQGERSSRRLRNRLSNFVFTLNNWTQEEYNGLTERLLSCRWACVAKETGESGTPHLQGAVSIGRQVAFSTIKTWPGLGRAHLEQMFGTPADSLAYCSKQDLHPFIVGTLPTPGNDHPNLFVTQAEIDDFLEWSSHLIDAGNMVFDF